MDKLKTRILFVSLIILALVSVSAVAAADLDDVVSVDQDDSDLSEETISNVEEASDNQENNVLSNAASSDNLDDDLKANEDGSSTITIVFHKKCSDGDVTDSLSNTISKGGSWGVGMAKFRNQVANKKYSDFKYQGEHYKFDHWEDAEGNTVSTTQTFYATGEDYEVHFYAIYEHSPIGSLTVNYIDNIAHGSGGMNYTEYGTNYKHTFKTPPDIPDAAVFLYWENENGTRYVAGDTLEIKYSEFDGINKVVNVYAVYDIKTSIELEEITCYVGDVVDITAKITEDLEGGAVPGGTATLTIDYDNKLNDGSLGASTYTDTVEVDEDGNAVFKDVKLENPGTYKYTVSYSGYSYNHHEEGINDYLSSEADSKLNILPLNTTTESEDVSGTVGDKVDIAADIVDQNGDPVQNGTAVLKVNGKEYTAEVKDGKAIFEGVELKENTTATIEYLGNDYYNPSNTTIEITVTAPEEPEEPEEEPEDPKEPEEEPEEPEEDPKEPVESEGLVGEPSTTVTEKLIPAIHAAGNPIVLVVLALLALVSTVSFGRKR